MSANASTEYGNELPVGYRLEEFEIKSILGSGGFGITYLALDIDLKRDVVVKENLPFQCAMRDSTRAVRPRTTASGDVDQFKWALNSFMREAETLSQFDHPNIVRILRRFEANNTAYFVMPYLPGKSLKQVIEEQVAAQEAFTESKLKDLLHPLLDALEVLHAAGVYHRDIKAANIMLVKGHRPILIDFGAARQVISEKSHTIVESAGYTPFEQLQSHGHVGPWSDIYALGATFYTAIHGESPPRASDRIRRDPIVKLADAYSDTYSRSFMEALDWALKVDETERPQSVAEWREALNGSSVTRKVSLPPALPKRDPAPTVRQPAVTVVKPPRQPSEPFPVMFVAKIVGAAAAALLLLALAIHLMWPLIAKPGSLHVDSNPSNATVQIHGQKDATTPADFPSLRIGKYDVTVSAPGYDPTTVNVEIKEGAACPLGMVQLKRAMGTLNLTTVPPHASYHLSEAGNPDAKDYEGATPVTLEDIPAGSYNLTLSASSLGTRNLSVDIAAHQTTKQTEDLVKLCVGQETDSLAGKVLLGQTPASQLDDSGKKDYIDLVTRVMNVYLRYNMFALAEGQADVLKQLGQNTQDVENKIAAARGSYQKSTVEQIKDLISDGRFAAASSKIKALGDVLGKDAGDQLTSQFQSQLATYQQQAADAIKQAQAGDPSRGYDQLKPLTDKHSDDVSLQLALADLLTHMTPDHDKLASRLAAFKAFNLQYLGTDEGEKFQDMQARLQNEFNTYNDLLAKLNRAKNGPVNLTHRMSVLQDEIDENQRKLAGGDGVNQAVNAVTGIFGAHIVTSAEDRREAIAREQAELDKDQAEQQNPQADVTEAQSDFDAFCAKVPW